MTSCTKLNKLSSPTEVFSEENQRGSLLLAQFILRQSQNKLTFEEMDCCPDSISAEKTKRKKILHL